MSSCREEPDCLPAWEEFVSAYRQPMIVWLTSRCGDAHLAEELVQSLLVKLYTRESALERVNPAKGRMRTWLLTSLRNHWIDSMRRIKGTPCEVDESLSCKETGEAECSYDLEWARALAGRALAGTREDYEKRGSGALFDELLVAMDDVEAASHGERAARLGMKPNSFAVALMRFRERVAARLWEEVAATVEGGAKEIDEELRHLIAILARSGGLRAALERAGE